MQTQVNASGVPLDAIFIPGDFPEHDLSAPKNTVGKGKPNWPQQLYAINAIMQILSTAFPNVPIFPSIGNNDV